MIKKSYRIVTAHFPKCNWNNVLHTILIARIESSGSFFVAKKLGQEKRMQKKFLLVEYVRTVVAKD